MKTIITKNPLLKSKRQPHKLLRFLTKARFENTIVENTVQKCGRSNCGLWKHLQEGKEFKFANKKVFKVNTKMNCEVKNVIYVITCRGCGENYIGETNNLRQRVTIHNQQIRDPTTRKFPLSAHIDNCSTSDPKYFIFPFYEMRTQDVTKRKMKEAYFIIYLKPKLNRNS